MDFQISTKAPGPKISPGVVEGLYILSSDLTTIATQPNSPATQAEKVTIATAHIPTVGEGFRKMYISNKKSELKITGEGDEDAKSAKCELEVFIPGLTANLAAFLYDDPDMIFLVPNGPCGTSEYFQLGTKCDGAKISKWEFTTGKFGGSEVKGVKATIQSLQSSILLYTAAIPVPA
jgi:hypothetical protein